MKAHLPDILSVSASYGRRHGGHDKKDDGHLDQTYEYIADKFNI